MSSRIDPQHPPEILPPRSGRGSRVFNDENLDMLAHVLDDWLRIPGTSIRFGLDAIVGLVPGIGDVLGGLASCILLVAAWFRGVPYVTLVRMAVNVGIEVLVGSVPLLGDAFDVAWKANRRNFKLLVRHVEQPQTSHLERLGISGDAWRRNPGGVCVAVDRAGVGAGMAVALPRRKLILTGSRPAEAGKSCDTINRCRGVAQSGSASALGAEGRGFESLRPDHGTSHLARSRNSKENHCSGSL